MQLFLQPEQLLLLWLHGHGLSFTLKPQANSRGIPAVHEWFSLLIPGAYLSKPCHIVQASPFSWLSWSTRGRRHSILAKYLKFMVSDQSKQAYIHVKGWISMPFFTKLFTHTRAECSQASVGLAQARLNHYKEGYHARVCHMHTCVYSLSLGKLLPNRMKGSIFSSILSPPSSLSSVAVAVESSGLERTTSLR